MPHVSEFPDCIIPGYNALAHYDAKMTSGPFESQKRCLCATHRKMYTEQEIKPGLNEEIISYDSTRDIDEEAESLR
jgi:hypothetical protein